MIILKLRWYTTLVKVFFVIFTIISLLICAAIIITDVVEDEKVETIISYLFLGILLTINSIVIICGFAIVIKTEINNWKKNKLNKGKKDWKEDFLAKFSIDGPIFADDEERLQSFNVLEQLLEYLPESYDKKKLWELIDTGRYNIRKKRKESQEEPSDNNDE